MPEMREHRYDPRTTLGPTRMRETYWEDRRRDAGIAQAVGERIIYSTWIVGLTSLTLATVYKLARKIIK
jgi:hypothetical protein